jgi:pyridoxine 5-phosphate synthase
MFRFMRLYINIDHVATVRQARRTTEPDPVEAALAAEAAGADGITAHLREDRRHIQDYDVQTLRQAISTVLNLEIACTDEMLAVALDLLPHQVTFVPERREEVTTEGGLNMLPPPPLLAVAVSRLTAAGIRSSLFIDPAENAVVEAAKIGVTAVELHTGSWANNPTEQNAMLLRRAAHAAARAGLRVHAGHGLTTSNVGTVAQITEIEELNIGHHIVSRAIMVGMPAAVREMREAITRARPAFS